MPRRNRPQRPSGPELGVARPTRVETFHGDDHRVQKVRGDHEYRCPGCDQLIAAGVLHVVAWSSNGDGDDRRHWHTPCWAARDRRAAAQRRSRGAPRY